MDQEIIRSINSELSRLLAQHQFILLTFDERKICGFGLAQLEYEDRGSTSLIWQNEKLFLEIYSDPQGGETNCRIAPKPSNTIGLSGQIVWKYLYELVPLSAEELSNIQTRRRSHLEQLEMIRGKLAIGLHSVLAAEGNQTLGALVRNRNQEVFTK